MLGDLFDIHTDIEDQHIVAEGWKQTQWPPPPLTEIKNGLIHLTNNSPQSVLLQDNKVNYYYHRS